MKIQKKRKETSFVTKLFVYLIFAVSSGIFLYIFFSPNYYEKNAPVFFTIKEGETLNSVTERFYDEGIIRNKTAFKIIAYLLNAEKKLKIGNYQIPNGLNYLQLVNLISVGQKEIAKLITIPEGIWQKDIAKIFKRELGIDSARFMELSSDINFIRSLGLDVQNLEGYLMPDTYYFYKDATCEDIIRKLVHEQNRFFDDSVNTRMTEMGFTRNKLLTLASIVDGESNIIDEFPVIARVYLNRLKIRMRLQADPTVQYLVRNKETKNRILYSHLEIDSPYNTYKYAGLPPTPINNPGKQAIQAVLNPDDNKYIYFVADGTGGHKFANSYSEHQKNVRHYRIVRKKNNMVN